jgi:hypothetical protein
MLVLVALEIPQILLHLKEIMAVMQPKKIPPMHMGVAAALEALVLMQQRYLQEEI